jgi:hypothetical protein
MATRATIAAATNKGGSLVCDVALSFRLMSTSPSVFLNLIAVQYDFCEISTDYSAVRDTDLDCLGFAAGAWLSMSTSCD